MRLNIIIFIFFCINLTGRISYGFKSEDSLYLRELHNKCWEIIYNDIDSALYYGNVGLIKSQKLKSLKFEASFHNVIASVFSIQADFIKAIEGYRKAYEIAGYAGDIKGQAFYANNLGNTYYSLGDTSKAIDYYEESLKLHLESENDYGLGLAYSNLSTLMEEMRRYDESFEFQFTAIPYKIKNDSVGLGESYFNLAMLYQDLYLLDDDSLQLFTDRVWQIESTPKWRESLLDSIGKYLNMSLYLHEKNKHIFGKGITLKGMADLYYHKGDYSKSIELFKESYKIAEEMDALEEKVDLSEGFYRVYKKKGDLKNALQWHETYFSLYIQIASDDIKKEVTKKEISFEFEKKSLEDSLAFAQETEKNRLILLEHETQLEKEKIIRIAAIGGLGFFVLLTVFIFMGYRSKKRDHEIISQQKKETEEKKLIIEEKQKEILDSINYAQRLQRAILTTPEKITSYLPNNFLFYLPKDIVAGDFYFFESRDDLIFIAAADCTGHGVPGALVSIVCSNALSRCVKEFKLTEPGEILDQTTKLVVETFEKSGENVKDGMDISFLCIDTKNAIIKWAGANNPIWYVSENEMHAIKADKQPVGKSENRKNFTTHILPQNIHEIDAIYLFTDGFADQFGGPKGKKYKYTSLKEFLFMHSKQSFTEQKNSLEQELKNWVNVKNEREYEQLDDICIIGFKPVFK